MDAAGVLFYATGLAIVISIVTTVLCAAAFAVSLISAQRQKVTRDDYLPPSTWAENPARAAGFVRASTTAMKQRAPPVKVFQGVMAAAALLTLLFDLISREAGFAVIFPTTTIIGPALTLCLFSLTITFARWTLVIRRSRKH